MYENVSKVTRNISEYPTWDIESGLENSDLPYRKWNSATGKYDYSLYAQAGYKPNPFYEKTEEDFYETLIDFSEITTESSMPLVEGKYAMLPDGSILEGTYYPYDDGRSISTYQRTISDPGFYKRGTSIGFSNNLPPSDIGPDYNADPWVIVRRFALNNSGDVEYGTYQKYNCGPTGHATYTTTASGELTTTILKSTDEPNVDRLGAVSVVGMYSATENYTMLLNDYTMVMFETYGDVPEYPDGRTTCYLSPETVDYNGALVSNTSAAAALRGELYWEDDTYGNKQLKFRVYRLSGTYSKRLTLVPSKSYVVCYSTWYKKPQYSDYFCFHTVNTYDESMPAYWYLCDYADTILASGEAYDTGDESHNIFDFLTGDFPLEDVEPGEYLLRIQTLDGQPGCHYVPVEIDTGYDEEGEPIWAFKSYGLDKTPYLGQGIDVDAYPNYPPQSLDDGDDSGVGEQQLD